MQADLEESKTQENAKLRTTLQEMQLEFQESKALLIKERESIKKEAEQVPTIQEVPVIDNELVNKLTAENEMLKVKLFMHCYFF
jgi:myosin-5